MPELQGKEVLKMMDSKKKRLPVGIEDFREIRTQDFSYIDKSTMIRGLLEKWGKVNLFTRPRRFGKTLNMSMLKEFFEIGSDIFIEYFYSMGTKRDIEIQSE